MTYETIQLHSADPDIPVLFQPYAPFPVKNACRMGKTGIGLAILVRAKRRDSVTSRVIEALQPSVNISIAVWDDSAMATTKKLMSVYKIDTNKLRIFVDPYADYWLRDHAVIVKDGGQLKVVAFNWTSYGQYPDLTTDINPEEMKLSGEFDERLAAMLKIPLIKSDFVFEGGGLETNGSGTFMIIKEMALQRNPGKTIKAIENELARTLGAKKIIWLKDGLAEDKQYKN